MQRRIILVGKTGNGKSSTANSILQENAFTIDVSPNAVTEKCLMKKGINRANTIEYYVVDTPGLFDTEKSVGERAFEIQKSVEICPEPHAFLIVFSAANRMTTDEKFTIDMLRIMFGECIFNHLIVVFTHGKMFESDSAFQTYWKQNDTLVNLIELCGNRVVKIDNTYAFPSDNKGTQSILEMVEKMSDGGKTVYRYTEFKTHRSVIEEHRKHNDGKRDIHEEISEIVRRLGEKVDNKLWKKMLYGGTLIGVALGAGYVAGTSGVVKAVGEAVKAVGRVATDTAEAAINTGIPSKGGAVVGEAVLSKVKLG